MLTCRNRRGGFFGTSAPTRKAGRCLQRRQTGILIVALKVGRTELAPWRCPTAMPWPVAMVLPALFDRFGVQRVGDMDELATALILFSRSPCLNRAPARLVSLHDNGVNAADVDLADEGRPLRCLGMTP